MKIFNDNDNNDKAKLKYYAEKAKEAINININYHKQKDIYENYIKEIKSILFSKEKIKENFIKINKKLKANKDKLQNEYNKIKSLKYDIYYKNCTDELKMGRPLLNQLKADNFTLEYTLSEKDNIIKMLNQNMKNFVIFSLFKQPKRDIFIDLKEGNSTIKEIMSQIQSIILKKSKKYNSLKENCKIKKKIIEQLKNIIMQLNEYIYLTKLEKAKINNENNIKPFCFQFISNQINTNSNLKTADRTISTYDTISNKKILENKENINNNGFELSNIKRKEYEEDSKYNDKNIIKNANIKNKNLITHAIMKTIIPPKKNSIKYLSVNPMINNDIEITIDKNSDENKNNFFTDKKALSAEERKTRKINNKKNLRNNKIIYNFQNLEELFGTSDSENEQEEIIIDSVIHSDDETTLEKKINSKKTLHGTYLNEIKSNVSKINLDLIEFNKLKVFQEVDINSLQRRNYKILNVEENIIITKKKIKKIKNRMEINLKKIEAMKKFIDDLKNKYILFKRIKTKSSAINSKVNYIANHEIIDLNQIEEGEDEDNDDIGSDYLNENDEITE